MLIASYMPTNRIRGSGVLILIPYETIDEMTDEKGNRDTTIQNIRRTAKRDNEGRIITITITLNGTSFHLTSAYAPSNSTNTTRADFFKKHLTPHIRKNCILCIDANCVPDPYQTPP